MITESNNKYNTLRAFIGILNNPWATVNPAKLSSNRINNVGDALEIFIKDAYSNILGLDIPQDIKETDYYPYVFSWLGNNSNPPDALLMSGDGIEVKKIQNSTANIALNSSYPKSKLHIEDSRVAQGAKMAEKWVERDMVYAIGTVNKDSNELSRLWLIYGDCYAASKDTYEALTDVISSGIKTITDIEFNVTNELANVQKVDPLGITTMRIRGMWHIQNPSKLYSHMVSKTGNRQYYLLMREDKYMSFSEELRHELEGIELAGYDNSIVEIRNPDNPAQLLRARFIKYEV